MRLRDRLRRAWSWATALVRPAGRAGPEPSAPATAAVSPPSSPSRSVASINAVPRARAAPNDSIVPLGEVTVRLWIVGGLVVLATSEAEAERALLGVVAQDEPRARHEAGRVLETLRAERAVAA